MMRRETLWVLVVTLAILVVPGSALAAPCATEDFEKFVSGAEQCLVMRRFGSEQPKTLVVWLHGDVSSGGPANYHFPIAEKFAQEMAVERVLSVALLRPGYHDGVGNESTVAWTQMGRSDHYTQVNVGEVSTAIERLRARFQPERLVVVGHSGGAATAAVMLGMRPQAADAAVLVSCPCDTVAWRSHRRGQPWSMSENPIKWVPSVPADARVVALTGERDDNTLPQFARDYVVALVARGIGAEFVPLPGETHNGAFRSPEVFSAVRRLLER